MSWLGFLFLFITGLFRLMESATARFMSKSKSLFFRYSDLILEATRLLFFVFNENVTVFNLFGVLNASFFRTECV